MKRVFAFLLSLALVFPLAAPAHGQSDAGCSVILTSDTHFTSAAAFGPIEQSGDPDNLYGHATIQGQMNAESEAIMNAFLENCADAPQDTVLIAGDLTDGIRTNHMALAAKFKAFEAQTGKRIFVICGNHDISDTNSETRILLNDFKEIYADFGYNEALAVHASSASYTARLDENYRLMAIDSCIYGDDEGALNDDILTWIKEQASLADADGVQLVAMMHHSLLPHTPIQSMIDGYRELAATFADLGIGVVFTGHLHANDISGTVSTAGNTVYDVMIGSLITAPNAYRTAVFSETSADIKTAYITGIDTADLPQGYTDAQLSLIGGDFSAYAHGFFVKGIDRWIDRYIGSAAKIARPLGIEEGTDAYDTLDKIMKSVGASLHMPLYNSDKTPNSLDSMEEIAASVGKSIPASDYEYAYQLAADILGGFYAGDETLDANSPEITLLYAVLRAALANALGTVLTENVIPDGLDELLKELGMTAPDETLNERLVSEAAKLTFMSTTADAVIASCLAPLIDGIVGDAYAPADLNVLLEPQKSTILPSDNTVPPNELMAILIYLLKIVNYLTEYAVL